MFCIECAKDRKRKYWRVKSAEIRKKIREKRRLEHGDIPDFIMDPAKEELITDEEIQSVADSEG